MELGGGKTTSGSILKHFLICRWQLPYIWVHDPPRKWDQSRWLNKWQLTQKRPRQSFKKYPMNRAEVAQIFSREETFRWNAIQKIHLGKEGKKTVRKLFWEDCCSNLVYYSLLAGWNLLISSGLNTELEDWYLNLLHLVLARETRASSGVLRSFFLSTLQELVGRNGLPLLLSSQA